MYGVCLNYLCKIAVVRITQISEMAAERQLDYFPLPLGCGRDKLPEGVFSALTVTLT